MPAFARAILIQESAEGGLSYKVKNTHKAFWLCGCLVDIWILFFFFSDVWQTSGYCDSSFSASSIASSAMRTRSLPSL